MSLLHRFLSGLLILALLGAGRAETVAEFEQRLQAAIEAGDFDRLAEIAKPFAEQPGTPKHLGARACSLLGIALAFNNPARAYEFFTTAAETPAEYVRATFWRAECQLFLNNPGTARVIAHELARKHPESPATAYVKGRIALHDYRALPADATAARAALESGMRDYLSRCTGKPAHAKRDFDPRFVSLAIEWHVERNELHDLARAYEEMLVFRPKNLRVIRTLLCLEVTQLKSSQIYLLLHIGKPLPPDEMDRWLKRREECALDHADPAYAAMYLGLADLAESSAPGAADVAPGRLFFLQRAAENLGVDDPRLAATVQRFAGLAAQSRQGTAASALALVDRLREWEVPLPLEAGVELRLCLAARDYARALPLAVAALPARNGDYDWLRAAWPALERGSSAVRRQVADALVRLKPDDLFSRLVAMRAYSHAAEPLPRFAAIFEGKPFVGTIASDWARYRELLLERAEENDFLDGGKQGAAQAEKYFEATVERWRKVLEHDVALMEQGALIAIRRANADTTQDSVREALAYVNGAITLGSTHASLAQSQPKLAAVYQTYLDQERAQSAADAQLREALQKAAARRTAEEAGARARGEAENQRAQERAEKLRLHIAYLTGIRADRDRLAQRMRREILSGATRAAVERDLARAEAILDNLCRSCSGLGVVQGNSGAPCGSCGGSGQINRNGPGAGAWMQ